MLNIACLCMTRNAFTDGPFKSSKKPRVLNITPMKHKAIRLFITCTASGVTQLISTEKEKL